MLISFPPAYTLYTYAYFSLLKNIINFIHTGLAFRRKKEHKQNERRCIQLSWPSNEQRMHFVEKNCTFCQHFKRGKKLNQQQGKKISGCITIEKKYQIIKCLGILLVLRNKTKIGKLTWNSFYGITGIRRTSLVFECLNASKVYVYIKYVEYKSQFC